MKKIILSISLLGASLAFAQVGINNTDPKATLDVTAKTTDNTTAEGIIAPRLTGNELAGKDAQYDTAQKGAIIYATSAASPATIKTANITAEGYYYFDGSIWTKFGNETGASTPEPWYIQNTTTPASANTQNIYQNGKVAVGFSGTDAVSGKQLDVKGDLRSAYAAGGYYSTIDNNDLTFGMPSNALLVSDNADLANATKMNAIYANNSIGTALLSHDVSSGSTAQHLNVATSGVAASILSTTTNSRNTRLELNSSSGAVVSDGVATGAGYRSTLQIERTNGINFNFLNSSGTTEGSYTFPRNNGAPNQVLTTNGNSILSTLSWQNVSDLIQNNDWHLTGNADTTAGTNFLGTTDTQSLVFKVNNINAGRISYYAGGASPSAAGDAQTSFGYLAAGNNIGTGTTAIGDRALQSNSGARNTGVGFRALSGNTTGANNTALGSHALISSSTGSDNTVMGNRTLQNNSTGSRNTAIGGDAGFVPASGNDNTMLGYRSGYNISGNANNNTLLGSLADVSSANLTNATAIGYNAKVAQSNSLILGGTGTEAVNVGINITMPTNRLHVVATADPARFEGLQAGAATDNVVVVTTTGVLKTVTSSTLAIEPWLNQADDTKATGNNQNIYQVGNVSIGSKTPIAPFTSNSVTVTPKLSIAGDVASTGAFYTTTGKYADYVFEDYFDGASTIDETYKFRSLEEIAAYIKANKHLPGVTSIKDILKTDNGYTVNLSELSIQQLEKIEELYLHTIEQQQEIAKQKAEINDLRSRMEKLEQLLVKEDNNK
jgi:hypothetical protein